jgi:hypothetical protein
MRNNQNHAAIDHIADTAAELADVAAGLGLRSLVYILRMAEIEARRSCVPVEAPARKPVARMARAA